MCAVCVCGGVRARKRACAPKCVRARAPASTHAHSARVRAEARHTAAPPACQRARAPTTPPSSAASVVVCVCVSLPVVGTWSSWVLEGRRRANALDACAAKAAAAAARPRFGCAPGEKGAAPACLPACLTVAGTRKCKKTAKRTRAKPARTHGTEEKKTINSAARGCVEQQIKCEMLACLAVRACVSHFWRGDCKR